MIRINTFLKNNYKKILLYLLIYLLFMTPMPYYVDTPGGAELIDDIKMNEEKINNEVFHKSYVSVHRGRIPILLLALLLDNWDIYPVSILPEEDYELSSKVNRLYLKHANQIATIVAYEQANMPIEIVKEEIIVTNVIEESKNEMKIGDILIALSFDQLTKKLDVKKPGDHISIDVKRNGQVVTTNNEIINIDGKPRLGIMGLEHYTIESDPTITITPRPRSEGPSGAFMLALTIYDQLVDEKIKSLKITGSGTLTEDGQIGSVSGLKYKLLGAEKENFDYFFIGQDNIEEVLTIKKQMELDINIKGFSNFEEAITFLYD